MIIISNQSFSALTNTLFVKIPHFAINDPRLSDGSLRLLLTLLANRDGFKFSSKAGLMKKGLIKKIETFEKRKLELIKLGYLQINGEIWTLTYPENKIPIATPPEPEQPPIIPTFEEEPPPSIVEDADYNENMAMYNQIMDYTKDKPQICWVNDFFEDDMWPVLRIAMQYDAIWKDKRNLDWRDYVFLPIDENVANAINEFVGVYRTMREAIIYLSGLHSEEFWRSKSLRDVFTFKKQTMQERYERALNNLNK